MDANLFLFSCDRLSYVNLKSTIVAAQPVHRPTVSEHHL